ncbi:MAG: site-2 protease family protein [Dermatophilus congolensis]|nr:site-2 protease family protein [Dermatophilus congolensis]
MYLLGVLFMVVAIGISIALHEIGHLLPAKKFGVACRQYMIGFGPTLWSKKIGETEYGIKAIPLGGYVRMIGMYPPRRGDALVPSVAAPVAAEAAALDTDGSQATSTAADSAAGGSTSVRKRGRMPWTNLIEEAREASMSEIRPGEEDRVFYKLSAPKKLAVMFGGPFMNLVIASVVMAGVFTLLGTPQPVGAHVASVAECVRPVTASEAPQAPCTAADQPSPAAAAGLQAGDRFVSIDGRAINGLADVSAAIRPAAGRTIDIVVTRDEQQLTLHATPIPAEMPKLDENGVIVTDAAGNWETVTTGYLGMTSRPATEFVTQPISEVPSAVATGVVETAKIVVRLPEKLVGVYEAAFGGEERDQYGPMSVVGVGRMAGEVAGGQYEQLTGARETMVMLWLLVASLNIALFVFNLIPLVPLDGGHMVGAAWEGVKRTVARIAKRPDPGYVDVARAMPLAYGVSLLFIGMAVLLIYADIVKPIRL